MDKPLNMAMEGVSSLHKKTGKQNFVFLFSCEGGLVELSYENHDDTI